MVFGVENLFCYSNVNTDIEHLVVRHCNASNDWMNQNLFDVVR